MSGLLSAIRSHKERLVALVIIEALVIASYVLTISLVDRAYESDDVIFDNAIPSIHHLSAVLRHTEALHRDLRKTFLDASGFVDPARKREVATEAHSHMESIEHHIRVYEALPVFPGELALQRRLDGKLAATVTAVDETLAAPDAATARSRIVSEAVPALESTSDVVKDLVDLDADAAANIARTEVRVVEEAKRSALAMLAGSTGLVALVWFLVNAGFAAEQAAQRRKIDDLDAFAARVAHDLTGPLAPMLMATSLLRRELAEPGSDVVKASFARMESGVHRMSALIDGLLDFSRAGAATAHARGVSSRAADAVERLLPALQATAAEERAHLETSIEPDLAIAAAPGVVASIVQNLVRNALIYLGESPERSVKLDMRADPSRRHAIIEVSDTGPGIPADVRARIFRPFERGTTSVAGSGLGLATVKRLAEGHGGSVALETEVGSGCKFTVRLPLAA